MIEISKHEVALCIAALDNAVNDLQQGMAAAARIGVSMPQGSADALGQMRDLRQKLMSEALK